MQAFILCGGKSQRMGRNKAAIKINGTTMAHHVANSISKAGLESIFMVSKPGLHFPSSYPFIDDLLAVTHPLSGVATALKYSHGTHALIVCCDVPRITSKDILKLVKGPYPCVAKDNKRIQPLCGIYPTSWANKAFTFATENKRAIVFAEPCYTIELKAKSLKNVNYPCDLGDDNADS